MDSRDLRDWNQPFLFAALLLVGYGLGKIVYRGLIELVVRYGAQ